MGFLDFNPQPVGNGRTSKNLAFSGTSANIALTPGKPYLLQATQDCYIRLFKQANAGTTGENVATSADMLLPGRTPMVLLANQQWDSIAVIQVSAAGILGMIEVQNPL